MHLKTTQLDAVHSNYAYSTAEAERTIKEVTEQLEWAHSSETRCFKEEIHSSNLT